MTNTEKEQKTKTDKITKIQAITLILHLYLLITTLWDCKCSRDLVVFLIRLYLVS